MLTFFVASFVKMKSRSNVIFKMKSKGIMFDSNSILKTMPKKVSISRENISQENLHRLMC